MAPIVKENEVLTPASTAARANAPATAAADTAGKTQAVALELPVSVNGARTVEGSDKREPFSEATKTVLVFGNGAVIRLQSPVAAGQLLFLTNEQTKKEVVCQVVKSKNYRSVSGYVELEFTEPVVGFWGMRFPSDRLGNKPTTSGAPSPAPIAVPASKNPIPATPKPGATANFNALKAMISSPPDAEPQKASPSLASSPAILPTTPSVTTPSVGIPSANESKATAQPSNEASTDELKLQATRLQQQFSSMLFTESSQQAPRSTSAKEEREAAAKVVEFSKPETRIPAASTTELVEPPSPNVVAQAAKPAPGSNPSSSQLESEEVKIPSWLEPLARNAAAASAAEAAKEEPKRTHGLDRKEEPIFETPVMTESLADAAPQSAEADVTPFTIAPLEEEPLVATPARSSNKGMVIGAIAAAVLLAAAGYTWYSRNQNGAAQASALPSSNGGALTATEVPSQNSASGARSASGSPAATTSPLPNSPVSSSNAAAGSGGATTASLNNAVAKTPQAAGVVPAPVQVEITPTKKPSLGEVRLAAPKVSGNGGKSLGATDEPGLALNSSDSIPGTALTGLSSSAKQPVAPSEPLPVGGDVKPAKLITTVSPIYPQLAKTQHVSGDVRIDALIDANGRVTTMKIVSGPTLLHQAAMDALHQWRYQPATLDGKAVPMHLTVTLQFRLQ
jgi:TonB family protein